MGSVRNLCNKGVLLENGKICFSGNIVDTIQTYLCNLNETSKGEYVSQKETNSTIYLQEAFVCDSGQVKKNTFLTSDDIYIHFYFRRKEHLPHTNFLVTIVSNNLVRVTSYNVRLEERDEVVLKIKNDFLVRGNYSLMTFLYLPGSNPYEKLTDICRFSITDANSHLSHLDKLDYGVVFSQIEEVK